MNKTTLDALLIDRALGALAPEMEALLGAYLTQNPEMTEEMDKTFDTVNLVRDLLKEEETVSLPEFHALIRIRQRKLRRYSLQVAGVAAALAIGLFFGHYRKDSYPTSTPSLTYSVAEIEPVPKAEHGIWSITPDRFMRKTRPASNWKWYSPVQQPRLINQGDAP